MVKLLSKNNKKRLLISISAFVLSIIIGVISTIPVQATVYNNEMQALIDKQAIAHEAADLLRKLGYSEDSMEIKGLRDIWWKANDEIEKIKATASYTEDELFCLAAVIYQEAGSDYICDECRYRVGDIVLNRVADSRFPNTIREVLEAKNQYGKFCYTGVKFPSRANNAGEKHAVERAYDTAHAILTNEHHSELYGKGYVWQAGFVQGKDNVYCCNHYYGR